MAVNYFHRRDATSANLSVSPVENQDSEMEAGAIAAKILKIYF
ncbi:hypothetical protein [Nostoc sp.]